MRTKIFIVSVVFIFFCLNLSASSFPQYSLPHTEIREIQSKYTDIKYILYISLPRNYTNENTTYPTVYTLDADYSFALAHNIIEHFTDRNDLPNMLVVSIAYDGASQNMQVYRENRIRDYTPIHTTNQLWGGYQESEKVSGGGRKFQLFLKNELIPFIEANYRILNNDRTIVGHSMGGFFGAYTLFTMPELFQRYILVSSSLWYADKYIFHIEQEFSESHDMLNANVYFCVGQWENSEMLNIYMSADQKDFVKQIKSRNYKGLKLSSHVFQRETHNSVFPAALSRGLRVVFGKTEF